jgi:hypothetical protein
VTPGKLFGWGAGGTDLYPLVFTNTGATTCTLSGYPSVSFVDDSGHAIAFPAVPTMRSDMLVTVPTRTTIAHALLAPGQRITAFAVYFAGGGSSCTNATPVHGIRVTPPGQGASIVVSAHQYMCANAPRGSLVIHPVGVGHL